MLPPLESSVRHRPPNGNHLRVPASGKNAGFTLIELLVVIVIVAVLAALLVPAVSRAIATAQQSKCASNLRELGLAMAAYASENDGVIVMVEGPGSYLGFWDIALSPYVGFSSAGDFAAVPVNRRPLGVFACPSSTNLTSGGCRSDYAKNGCVSFDEPSRRKLASVKSPSKVIFLGDGNKSRGLVSWYGPTWGIAARHGANKRANFVFLDGHVESLLFTSIPLTGNADQKYPWSDKLE